MKTTSDLSFGTKLVETRASKGFVKDQAGVNEPSETTSIQNYRLFLDMVHNDPLITAAFDTIVDISSHASYDFVPLKDNVSKSKEAKEFLRKFNFELDGKDIIDNLTYSMLYYGDAYLELRRGEKTKQVKELWPLETTEMGIKFNDHGKIEQFVQETNGVKKDDWVPKDVVFFRLKWIGSKVNSYNSLEAVAKDYTTSVNASNYLQKMFLTIPPKIIYGLKNANKTQRTAFVDNLVASKNNPNIDLVVMGEIEIKKLFLEFDPNLVNLLNYIRSQVLTITRVPAFLLSVNEGGTARGDSEAKLFSFEARIRKLQQKIEQGINQHLLPEMGIKDIEFRFNPFSLKDEKTILENAERMFNLGVSKERVAEFLSARGITVTAKEIDTTNIKKDKELNPSRRREDVKTDDMTSNIDQKGVSDEREDKSVEMRSSYEKYNHYPYVIEPS
jgi:hypothetical protein